MNIRAEAMKRQWIVNAINWSSVMANLALRDRRDPEKVRLFRTVMPYSMASYRRLDNVFKLAHRAERDALPGAFVECGAWRGGCSAIMASVAHDSGSRRKTWLFDSFEGLPEPTVADGTVAGAYASRKTDGRLSSIRLCVGTEDKAKEILFGKLKLPQDDIVIRKGWFQDTLPIAKNEVGPIAILRLDGDWYESTRVCLEHLYDLVVPGGYVIIDDYGTWEGCRKAVDEFLQARGLHVDLVTIDNTGRYFKKP
jgi:hypothetical protein